ncbi:MAG TPA: indolepyruvate oxidoreductase subunit beta [bacterium]|nr:indolepyruvate oxidoreductase subunit beta [bacterium]
MAEKENINILIVGVGGQGIILASRIIAQAFVDAGYDVKQSEVHGMAQRGGAVSSHIRAGEKVYSPLVPALEADYVLSFERLEVLRYMQYISKKTTVIINDQRIDPPSVSAGEQEYPGDIVEQLKKKTKKISIIPAAAEACEIGNERVVNVLLTGVLAGYLPVGRKAWGKTLKDILPPKLLDINNRAFDRGIQFSNQD